LGWGVGGVALASLLPKTPPHLRKASPVKVDLIPPNAPKHPTCAKLPL
jgi:hypothetical protein